MTNNKSKVLMVRVPTIIDSSASTAPICPPLGMAYLKRVISHYTDNIKVIDSVGNFPKTRSEYLGKHKLYLLGQNVDEIISTVPPDPEIIFISCMFSQDWLYAKEIIRRLREKCKGSVLIIGGEHVTSLPTFCLNDAPGLDMAVLGEGEAIVSEILKEYFLNSCKIPSEISGTYVRLPDGSIKENGRSLRIKK